MSVVESGKSIVNVHPPNWYRGTYSGVKTAAGEHQPGSLRELGQVLWEVKLCGRPSSGIFRINELKYENLRMTFTDLTNLIILTVNLF